MSNVLKLDTFQREMQTMMDNGATLTAVATNNVRDAIMAAESIGRDRKLPSDALLDVAAMILDEANTLVAAGGNDEPPTPDLS